MGGNGCYLNYPNFYIQGNSTHYILSISREQHSIQTNLVTKSSSKFEHDNPFTIGVEEEYMLCDPETGNLINRADEIMDRITDDIRARYSYEIILSEIEVKK